MNDDIRTAIERAIVCVLKIQERVMDCPDELPDPAILEPTLECLEEVQHALRCMAQNIFPAKEWIN